MKRISALIVTLGIAAASLSSCSRSNYAFNTTAPAYLGSEKVQTEAPATASAAEPMASAAVTIAARPTASVAPATEAAAPAATPAKVAARPVAAAPATTEVAAASTNSITSTIATSSPSRVERKALRHQVKQVIASHKSTAAEGKSQLTAVLLSFFLGGLGIDRFYLGYTGIGILKLLTFGVFGILALIDFIRIIIGDLKPKDGEYAKKL